MHGNYSITWLLVINDLPDAIKYPGSPIRCASLGGHPAVLLPSSDQTDTISLRKGPVGLSMGHTRQCPAFLTMGKWTRGMIPVPLVYPIVHQVLQTRLVLFHPAVPWGSTLGERAYELSGQWELWPQWCCWPTSRRTKPSWRLMYQYWYLSPTYFSNSPSDLPNWLLQ